MGNGFVILGGVLMAFSLVVMLVVAARTWPSFAPDDPEPRVRFARYVQAMRAGWSQRPAWKVVRYPGVTGAVWLLAGLIINALPAGVTDQPLFHRLFVPLLTYGPVLFLFFADQVQKKR